MPRRLIWAFLCLWLVCLSQGVGCYTDVADRFDQGFDAVERRTGLSAQLSGTNTSGRSRAFSYREDGLLQQETVDGQSYAFGYDSGGLLTARENAARVMEVITRDGAGRNRTVATVDASNTLLGLETQAWSGLGQRASYTANWPLAAQSSGSSSYSYNPRGQLLSETDGPSSSQNTFFYQFDNETNVAAPGAGLGVRTSAARLNFGVAGQANGSVAAQNQDAFQRPYWEWQAPPAAQPGAPAEMYTQYDNMGAQVWRSFIGGSGQALTWDGLGRLVQADQRDSAWTNGSHWTAIYDGLGRRIRATQQAVSGGVLSGSATTIDSYYDPEVEFLELGVSVNGARTWSIYGPDLNGVYGGLDGIGGLEATEDETSGNVTWVIGDAFGNVVASAWPGVIFWPGTQISSYRVMPGSAAPVLDGTSVSLGGALVWRSKRIDPTGLYWLGARYYDPATGRFISADPLGHAASMSLYDYCGGDPVNGLDPDGRFGKGIASGYQGHVGSDSPDSGSFNAGMMVAGLFSGVTQGVNEGSAIFNDTVTFGQINSLHKYTNTLQGGVYDWSRGFAQVGVGSGLLATGGAAFETPAIFNTAVAVANNPIVVGLGGATVARAVEQQEVNAATAGPAAETTAAGGSQTTVIGRMEHLEQFADNPAVDTWAKSGRIPAPGEPPVTWAENKAWLDERIARGDQFGIATDPATLPPVKNGYIPGQPNGYFTARELQYLQQQGISVMGFH